MLNFTGAGADWSGNGINLIFHQACCTMLSMNTDPLEMARHFREMSNEELLSLCSSASLNEIAEPIAIRELTFRGLPLPEPVSAFDDDGEHEGDFALHDPAQL